MVAIRIVVSLTLVMVGTAMVVHGTRRRKNWSRYSDEPLPWWWSSFSWGLTNLTRPDQRTSDRAIERQGTVAEIASGLFAVLAGLVLWHLRNG